MKKLHNTLVLAILILTLSSCAQLRRFFYPLKRKEINKQIRLDYKIPNNEYIAYENNSIIVYLNRSDILDLLEESISNPDICKKKVQRYERLFQQINSLSVNGYVIKPNNLMDFQGYLYSLDSADLSMCKFEKYWDDYVLKTEYGFEPQFNDTINAVKIKYFHDWIVSSLIVKGNATLIRKSNNEIQKKVILRRIDMKDGHGMDDLLFTDETHFFNVNLYSGMIFPDFECLESNEIKTYMGY